MCLPNIYMYICYSNSFTVCLFQLCFSLLVSFFPTLQVQTDPCVSTESLLVEMSDLNRRLEELERQGVELEKILRDCEDGG